MGFWDRVSRGWRAIWLGEGLGDKKSQDGRRKKASR